MFRQVFNGPVVGLEDMLAAREKRSFRQQQLLEKQPEASLLCASMNIPGPVKTSQILSQVFEGVLATIRAQLADQPVFFEQVLQLKTGCEYYLLTDLPAKQLKKKMVNLESEHPLGRIMDLDVLELKEGQVRAISRQHLGQLGRSCYICQKDAKSCGRSRRHSIEDLRAAIHHIITQTNERGNL